MFNWGGLLMVSEAQSIITMMGQGGMQADTVQKELRVLQLDMSATGSCLRHWEWLERI